MAATTTEEPEEYPTKKDLIRAGAVALLTALVGFAFTYAIFVRPYRQGKGLARLDRRAAESSQPAAYRQSDQQAMGYSMSYGSGGSEPTEKRRSKLEIKVPERKAAVAQAAPTPTPSPSATALPLPDSAYQQRQSNLQVRAPKPQLPSESPAATGPPPRPSEVSYAEAWQRASRGWITMGDGLHVGGQAVQISENQILTTLSAFRSGSGACLLGGMRLNVSLVASDSRQDLALLQIQGGQGGVPVPLSPEGPSNDQTLICGDMRNAGRYLEVRSRGQTGPCSAFDSYTSAIDGGAPLINNRGELVALSLPKPTWTGMSWNLAIPASACRAFIDSHPSGAGMPLNVREMWVQAIKTHVGVLADRETPNRANSKVMPGVALGNYPLGLSGVQLRKELGNGEVLEQSGGFARILYSAPRLTFTLADNVVVAVETDYNFYTLGGGLGVGSAKEPSELLGQFSPAVTHDADNLEALSSRGLELIFSGSGISLIRVVPQ